MHACAAAGAAFLIAVLWFDLMFDVQTRKHADDALPRDVLASISAYYRRVTIEAYPMNRLIAVVMILTLLAIVVEIFQNADHWWITWISLAAAVSAIGLARARTIPNAMQLGRAAGSIELQSALARAIYRDHLYCLAAIAVVLVLQLSAAL
jgi:cytochrome bd-type quinol oxidase subunit 2